MIAEDADAAAHFAGRADEISRPAESEWPEWSDGIHAAFQELRDDRFYGAMGGRGRIYFHALSEYARRNAIDGAAFDEFVTFMRALDDEYLERMAERDKQEAEKARASKT